MDNRLLNRLTKQDIDEIRQIMFELNKEIREDDSICIPNDDKYCNDVLKRLRSNNRDYKPLCKERYKVLLSLAEKVTDHSYSDNRQFGNVVIKCLVSNRLRDEGYSFNEIGRAMNKHHSTVMFYIGKMSDMLSLPIIYSEEMRMRSLFNDAIDEYDKQE